jgi:hypothetical protein
MRKSKLVISFTGREALTESFLKRPNRRTPRSDWLNEVSQYGSTPLLVEERVF